MMISELVAGQHCMLYSVATLFLRWMQHLRCTNKAPFSPIVSHTYIVVGNVDLLDVTHCGLWFKKLGERERAKKKKWVVGGITKMGYLGESRGEVEQRKPDHRVEWVEAYEPSGNG